MTVVADLGDIDAPPAIAAAIHKHGWEGAGILVNNAGITVKHEGKAHENDFSKHGITCNSIAPGFVASAMTGQLTPQLLQALVDRTPVGRGGLAEELGSAIAYLASENAGFLSGTCLDVNGGQTMS